MKVPTKSKTRNARLLAAIFVSLLTAHNCLKAAEQAFITVHADKPGAKISPTMWGIFFEEINFAGEGGLYAEMVRNRSLDNSTNADFWTLVTQGTAAGQMSVDTSRPLNTNNLRSLKLTMQSGTGSVGAGNAGFWGMALQSGAAYDLSFYARGAGAFTGPLSVRLERADGSQLYAQTSFNGLTTNWQRFTATLTPGSTDTNARIVLSIAQSATVWLDVVSLFPRATFHNRTNGMRADLANMLHALNPSFLRFPGGNFVEGNVLSDAVRWKKTIGDVAARPGHRNSAWGYLSTDGLGQHEYLQLCEDLGCEPLFGVNCGLALGYNGSTNNTVPLAEMGPWVQDALDAIEYCNGDTNTTWGALRAANGHPAPFNLKYIEIGNENGGSYYNDRYALFYDAIKANYPDMNIIACVWGGTPNSRPLEIIDEHYYTSPATFISYATKYDSYSRSGPKVFVGEYAVTQGYGTWGNLSAALGEAAFMTGIERNSDVVVLASYAPLFANVNSIQWKPDLIYYDSSRHHETPSYYVQQMFSQNRGDVVLPMVLTLTNASGTNQLPHGAIGLGAWNTQVQYTNIVVTRNSQTNYQSDFTSGAPGWQVYNGTWSTSGGVYQQTANTTDCRSTTGDTAWSDYTITLRARKTGGSEGFLILFNWLDDANWTWWNTGGWGNTLHGIEQSVNGNKSLLGSQVSGSIQNNQWYDIRIELSGSHVQCYLNNVLIHDVSYPISSHQGAVGVGTWATSASFTNIVVAKNGQTNFQSSFASGSTGWTVTQGTWSTSGGLYRQTSTSTTDCRSTAGNTDWSDYTLSLRARKDGGNEGFLIIFNWLDNNNFTWWNIGGWGNTQHGIEYSQGGARTLLGSAVSGQIQTGVWYDIRIELSGSRIRCYLNNVLVHDLSYPVLQPLLASASYHEASGQVILKVVNVSGADLTTELNLDGVASITQQAGLVRLTSASPADENTLVQPTKVSPVPSTILNAGTNFTHTFPANSLSVIRLQTPPTLPTLVRLDVGTNANDLALLPGGVPVRLSSFITNNVSVNFKVEAADGTVVTNGTLQFVPGQLVKIISLAASAVSPGTFLRVTLSNPVNGDLGDVYRSYFVQRLASGTPLAMGLAAYTDETLIYWTDNSAQLLSATNLLGPWTSTTNPVCPVRIPQTSTAGYYRLIK